MTALNGSGGRRVGRAELPGSHGDEYIAIELGLTPSGDEVLRLLSAVDADSPVIPHGPFRTRFSTLARTVTALRDYIENAIAGDFPRRAVTLGDGPVEVILDDGAPEWVTEVGRFRCRVKVPHSSGEETVSLRIDQSCLQLFCDEMDEVMAQLLGRERG